jgi:hypothetical protein
VSTPYLRHQEVLSAALQAYWGLQHGALPLSSSERMAAALRAVADELEAQQLAVTAEALRGPPAPRSERADQSPLLEDESHGTAQQAAADCGDTRP